jgi:gliding motility-associated-like protein
MASGLSSILKKLTLSLLILYGLTISLFPQDSKIGGKINVYRRVVAIGPGSNNVTLNSVDSIAPNDTVMLIQMQGVAIGTDQDAYGIGIQDTLGTPGGYEFLLVQSVNSGTKEVVFKNNIVTSFSVKGNVQLITVPYYNSATVTSTLTARSWDKNAKVGGVVAMIVGRRLKLEADIDVSYKGFYGGLDTIGNGLCAEVDPLNSKKDAYNRSWLNAGYKGEGLASHDPSLAHNLLYPSLSKGQGINFTGGGGGNGRFSGGGGGSNRGLGGDGTAEKYDFLGINGCTDFFQGAYGGTSLRSNTYIKDGIFFGGGGGSSTHATGSNESHGGRGGGIVIIIADTISGNNKFIKADGAAAVGAGLNGGGGGGGAGGSVIISAHSYFKVLNEPLNVSVKGGNGGVSSGGYGNGGGGGGGLIWLNRASTPSNLNPLIGYGLPGPGTPVQGNGEIKYNFSPKLNGFLFNSIISAVTGNQVDSICSNMPFVKISGTVPVGGKPLHTFKWQSSIVSESTGFADAAGVNNLQDYSPGTLSATTWFRRVVTDGDAPPLVDVSLPVKVIVQQNIKKTTVIASDTICYSQNPVPFTSKELLQDGNGKYTFVWKVSLDDVVYKRPANTYNTESYTPPPALTKTSWYKRIVTSGRCVDSTAFVKLTVLDTIANNKILSLPQEICFGTPFANLNATTTTSSPDLKGGDGVFRYRWETKVNAGAWVTAPGTYNADGYDPVEQPELTPFNENYFRRVVLSGKHDVCVNTSKPILLKDFPIIRNNTVASNQTICSGSAPSLLIGSKPPTLTGGNTVYTYTWEVSTKVVPAWTVVSGANLPDYQPPVLTDTTKYRRVVTSSLCSDISAPVTISVHKPISNNIVTLAAGGADTTMCNNGDINLFKGTIATGGTNVPLSYTYQWVESPDNATWINVSAGGTSPTFNPPVLTAAGVPKDYYYARKVSSGTCLNSLSTTRIKVTVLPVISNNVIKPDKPKVCFGTVPLGPIATDLTPVSGGAGAGTYVYSWQQSTDGGATWGAAAGAINSATGSLQPPSLTVETQYKRTIVSGGFTCSVNTSVPITIGINTLPTASITSTAAMQICYPGTTIPIDINITGTAAPWKVTLNENSTPGAINNVALNTSTLTVSPTTTTGQTSYTYTYTLGKVEDANGCLATSMSASRVVNLYKMPVPEAGSNDITCGQSYGLKAIPTVGTGTWIFPPQVVASTGTGANATVTMAPFSGGNAEYWFVWKETNAICSAKDSVKIHFDKAITAVDPAGPNQDVYNFVTNTFLDASLLQSWETGLWALEGGAGTPSDPTDPKTAVTGLDRGVKNTFSWTITNGSCVLKDLIDISLYDLVFPKGFSPNNGDVFNETYQIKGLDLLNQKADLTILNSAGAVVFATSNRDGQTWSDWNGKDLKGNDVPEGTYFYIIKMESAGAAGTGEIQQFKGYIILKRF